MTKTWHQNFKKSSAATRTDEDGVIHASKLEAQRWGVLKQRERLKIISCLRRQVNFALELGLVDGESVSVKTPTGRVAKYRADFVYFDQDGATVIEDTKGFFDRYSNLKISVFEAFTGHKVKIVKRASE